MKSHIFTYMCVCMLRKKDSHQAHTKHEFKLCSEGANRTDNVWKIGIVMMTIS